MVDRPATSGLVGVRSREVLLRARPLQGRVLDSGMCQLDARVAAWADAMHDSLEPQRMARYHPGVHRPKRLPHRMVFLPPWESHIALSATERVEWIAVVIFVPILFAFVSLRSLTTLNIVDQDIHCLCCSTCRLTPPHRSDMWLSIFLGFSVLAFVRLILLRIST